MELIKKKIFVVEDDPGIQELYLRMLEDDFHVRIFPDGKSFFLAIKDVKPDLIILDIMLPDISGYDIIRILRKDDESVPIIIVSAKQDELTIVKSLERGADDYITKSFSPMELIARINAIFRRLEKGAEIKTGDLVIDENKYETRYKENKIVLTLKEFELLRMLVNYKGKTISRKKLLKDIWDIDFDTDTRTLDMHIASLRLKLTEAGMPMTLYTVRGVGYRFDPLPSTD